MKQEVLAYRVIEDCTLECTNFEAGDIIEIPEEPHYDWKGTEFYNKHSSLFEPLFSIPS